MALPGSRSSDSPLLDLRRRGQFLFSLLLWASAAGFLVVTGSGTLVAYHYAISLAERVRLGLGFAPPAQGPDFFLLIALSSGPLAVFLGILLLQRWYRRIWLRRVALVWPNSAERRRRSRWQPLAAHPVDSQRKERADYLEALLESPAWSDEQCPRSQGDDEGRAEW